MPVAAPEGYITHHLPDGQKTGKERGLSFHSN